MNRKIKILSIILLVILAISIPVMIQNRDQVDWVSLGQVTGLFLIFYILYRVTLIYRYKRIQELIEADEYETALFRIKNLFRLNLFPNVTDQRICLQIAILALKHDDRKSFLRYINKLEHPQLKLKQYFWKAILHFREGSIEKAQMNYERFLEFHLTTKGQISSNPYNNVLKYLFSSVENESIEAFSNELVESFDPRSVEVLHETVERIKRTSSDEVEEKK